MSQNAWHNCGKNPSEISQLIKILSEFSRLIKVLSEISTAYKNPF
jgi:hypothetical protein